MWLGLALRMKARNIVGRIFHECGKHVEGARQMNIFAQAAICTWNKYEGLPWYEDV